MSLFLSESCANDSNLVNLQRFQGKNAHDLSTKLCHLRAARNAEANNNNNQEHVPYLVSSLLFFSNSLSWPES